MGHHSCCNQQKVKRGLWSPEEDEKLVKYITTHGYGCWSELPEKAGLQRCGKSCRLRWINYLRPDIRRGRFTAEEEKLIISLHEAVGNRWTHIASHLPGRTDNEIKNYWNSWIRKRLRNPSTTTPTPNTDQNSQTFYSSTQSNFLNQDLAAKGQLEDSTQFHTPTSSFLFDSGLLEQLPGDYPNRMDHFLQEPAVASSSEIWSISHHQVEPFVQSTAFTRETDLSYSSLCRSNFIGCSRRDMDLSYLPPLESIENTVPAEEQSCNLNTEGLQKQELNEWIETQQSSSNYLYWDQMQGEEQVQRGNSIKHGNDDFSPIFSMNE